MIRIVPPKSFELMVEDFPEIWTALEVMKRLCRKSSDIRLSFIWGFARIAKANGAEGYGNYGYFSHE